jgi:hypothetical protein
MGVHHDRGSDIGVKDNFNRTDGLKAGGCGQVSGTVIIQGDPIGVFVDMEETARTTSNSTRVKPDLFRLCIMFISF